MSLFPMALLVRAGGASRSALGCVVFGLQLHWSTVPLSVPVMALVLLAFLPFGVLFAALTVVVKQGNVGTSWVIALLSIIGGLYFPVSLLPQLAADRSRSCSPSPPPPSLLRHLLVDSPLGESPQTSLLKLVAFAGVLVPASLSDPRARDPFRSAARNDHRVLTMAWIDYDLRAVPDTCRRSLASKVTRPQHVVYRSFPSETVVLNLQTGSYHGLNATAGRMLDGSSARMRARCGRGARERATSRLRTWSSRTCASSARRCSSGG